MRGYGIKTGQQKEWRYKLADIAPVADALLTAGHADVQRVLAQGVTRCSVVLKSGLQVDLRAIAPAGFGAAWLYFTGHSRHQAMVHGLDADGLLRLMERIDALNATLKVFVLLKGVEVDILENGSLDLPVEVLGRLDLLVGAIHSSFGFSQKKQTAQLQHPGPPHWAAHQRTCRL